MRIRNNGRSILGLHVKTGEPIFEPKPAHRILFAAAGGGKTTCGVVPFLQSMISDTSRAMIVNDPKEGEIAAQCIDMCLKAGRKVALYDPFNLLDRTDVAIDLNPFGAVVQAYRRNKAELLFSCESTNQSLIEEPDGDQKNYYWRQSPRELLEIPQRSLLKKDPRRCRPGEAWTILSDPELCADVLEIEAEVSDSDEGDAIALSARARNAMALRDDNASHWSQHIGAAVDSLRIFEAGSVLHEAGRYAEKTHVDLLRDKYVVFLVGPQRYMDRLGALYALQIQGFLDALLSRAAGPVDFVLDEATNSPIRDFLKAATVMRGYGGRIFVIVQSRSELIRRFSDKLTDTLLENCVTKQWFGFSSPAEAKIVSDAMGEALNIQPSHNQSSESLGFSASIGYGREPVMSVNELMSLPANQQIIHIKDVGFFRALKVRQDEIAPTCHDLTDNPLEGGRFDPNPKITLVK